MSDAPFRPEPDVLIALSRAVTTSRLLSGLVHEINNALLVISGTVEVLGQRGDVPPPLAEKLERIRRQTERASVAITQVTAFTRATTGKRGEVDLTHLARVAVELRRFAAARAGLTLEYAPPAGPARTHGDAGQLQQAILNLIIAAEAALAGTHGRIRVEVAAEATWVAVRVTDSRTAAGVDRSEAAFEPFASAATGQFSGLGLFGARAIAAAHGGELAFDETAETASLVMRLPAAQPAARAD